MNQSATAQVSGAHHCQHQVIKMLHLCRDKVCWTCEETWTLLEQLPNRTLFASLCMFASAVCVAFPQRAHLLARLKPRPAVHDSVPTSNGAAHSAFTKHSKSLSSDAQVLPVAKLLCHHSASWQARLRSVENAAKFQPARGIRPTKRCTSRQNTIWRHQRWLAVGRSRDKVLRTRGDVTVPRKWRVMMSHVQSHVSTHEGSISRNLSAQVRVSLGPRYACGEASRWCRTGGVEKTLSSHMLTQI